MTKTIIIDTHVLYDIGLNNVSIKDVRKPGERLCYSPISVIELVSKLDDRSFDDRKAAAGAILMHGIHELPDPESHLTNTFGYKLAEPAPSYADAVLALAEGHCLDEVKRGIPDYGNLVRRTLNVPFAATWRDKGEREWVDSLIHLMVENIPRFRKWYATDSDRRSPSVPKLRGDEKQRFLAGMRSREWFAQVIAGCQMRAFIKADNRALGRITRKKVDDLVAAIPKIECFTHIYTQYLVRLMTEGLLPRQNDSGDIDLFLYSTDDDHIVATNEKKWIALAESAGFTRRIRTYGHRHGMAERQCDHNCPYEEAARYRLMSDAARYRKMNIEEYVKITQTDEWNRTMEETPEYRERTFEQYIETRPGVRGGKPCFKGTRITVQDVLEYLAGGMTEAELLHDFPNLTKRHILAARDYSYAHKLHPASGFTA